MSIQSHLLELERRHEALEREIESQQNHPATSDLTIKEMKLKKLHLKQEIVRLRTQVMEPALH